MRPFQEAPLGPGPCAPTAGRLSPFSSSFAVFSSGGLHAAAGGCSEDVRSAEKIKQFAIKHPAHAPCSVQQEPQLTKEGLSSCSSNWWRKKRHELGLQPLVLWGHNPAASPDPPAWEGSARQTQSCSQSTPSLFTELPAWRLCFPELSPNTHLPKPPN